MAAKRKLAAKASPRKRRSGTAADPIPEINHVMVYSEDVARSLAFYRDLLGFRVIEEMDGYARLRGGGNSTLGLHTIHKGEKRAMDTKLEGLRIYFEVPELDKFCAALEKKGASFKQRPMDMPWGWRHAYLDDPDGHELSLFSAGKKRFEKSPAM